MVDVITRKESLDSLNTCRNCKFSWDLRSIGAQEESYCCRRYPPTTIVEPVQRMTKHGMQLIPTVQAKSPNVSPDWTCGEFAMKLAVAN